MSDLRVTPAACDGGPLLTYLSGVREGRSWADLVELAPNYLPGDAVPVLLLDLPGWVVSLTRFLGAPWSARAPRCCATPMFTPCDEYQVSGADVPAVLNWAKEQIAARGARASFTLYAPIVWNGEPGLVRPAGTDPTAVDVR